MNPKVTARAFRAAKILNDFGKQYELCVAPLEKWNSKQRVQRHQIFENMQSFLLGIEGLPADFSFEEVPRHLEENPVYYFLEVFFLELLDEKDFNDTQECVSECLLNASMQIISECDCAGESVLFMKIVRNGGFNVASTNLYRSELARILIAEYGWHVKI